MAYIENRTLKIKLKGNKQFNSFIQTDEYEEFLYNLLKKSSFFSKLERIEVQNNKEDDYRELNNEGQIINTYEATLLANRLIMKNISIEGNSFPAWKLQRFIDDTIKEFKNALERKINKNNGNNRNIIIFNLLPIEIKYEPHEEIITDIFLKKNNFKKEKFKDEKTKDKDIWYRALENIKCNNPELLKNKEKIYIVTFNAGREKSNFYIKKLFLEKEQHVFNEQIEFINNYKESIYPFEILYEWD